jgi:hypothetical protein
VVENPQFWKFVIGLVLCVNMLAPFAAILYFGLVQPSHRESKQEPGQRAQLKRWA